MKCDAVIEKIKARVAAVDPSGERKVLGVFQLNIKAADGTHNWIVDLKNLKVSEGTASSPDTTLNISDEDFILLGTKQMSVKDGAAAGKIEIIGDKALASALMEVI